MSVSDAENLKKVDPSATLVLIPRMNHVLKDVDAGQEANMAAYFNPKLSIDSELSASIAGFIRALQPAIGDRHAY